MGPAVIMLEVVSSASFVSLAQHGDFTPSVRSHRLPEIYRRKWGLSGICGRIVCCTEAEKLW